jgi:transcriptional regulator with XRE-family HTH domain
MRDELTKLGELIEQGRAELRISAREAARRAGISPTRWRQVVTGEQSKNGRPVPVNPTARTVVAMALAVRVAPAEALAAAGHAAPRDLAALVSDVQREASGQRAEAVAGPAVDLTAGEHARLTDEIARIEGLRLPESVKLTMLEALIRAWERYAAERGAGSDAGSAAG